jgi:hypothetical protein
VQKKSSVTLEILREVSMKYTPTRFKSKYSTIFATIKEEEIGDEPSGHPIFTMDWEQAAKDMLEMVPSEFLDKAIRETENYARENSYAQITVAVVEGYRKKLGF